MFGAIVIGLFILALIGWFMPDTYEQRLLRAARIVGYWAQVTLFTALYIVGVMIVTMIVVTIGFAFIVAAHWPLVSALLTAAFVAMVIGNASGSIILALVAGVVFFLLALWQFRKAAAALTADLTFQPGINRGEARLLGFYDQGLATLRQRHYGAGEEGDA